MTFFKSLVSNQRPEEHPGHHVNSQRFQRQVHHTDPRDLLAAFNVKDVRFGGHRRNEIPTRRLKKLNIDWEFFGSAFGILGAYLLATSGPYARFGWVAFFISNLFWIAFSVKNGFRKLFWQQIAFMVSSSIGLYNGFWM